MRSRLLERIHPTELIEARAAAESKPLPAPPAPKPLGWGRAMLDYLRAEAPAAPPLPSRDLIEYVTAVSTAIHADYERHLDTLRVIDDIAASAPDTHTLAMALAPVVAMLKGLVA